jgi:hypothetical protein
MVWRESAQEKESLRLTGSHKKTGQAGEFQGFTNRQGGRV